MTIAITGNTGFLGTHVTQTFEAHGIDYCFSGSRTNFDLTSYDDCISFLRKYRPTQVVHLAALSGGIGANRERPDEFFHTNLMLVANMFKAAVETGVSEIVYTFGGCSYPNSAKSPIKEEDLWQGIPHGDSAPYSIAKKLGVVAAKAYAKYGLKSKLLIPGNMYGEYDNYSLENSHVIPAMIRKFYEAKIHNEKTVTMWGDGSPTRDFVYAGDVANAIVKTLNMDLPEEPINLSTGTSISIRELAENVSKLFNYSGEIVWDASKPNGQQDKVFSVAKAQSLGLQMRTNLSEGLEKTTRWFQSNYDNPGKVRL